LTLTEALVAVALLALVFSALWAAHRALHRTWAPGGSPHRQRARTLAELAELAAALQCAWDDGNPLRPPLRGGREDSGLLFLEFRALRPEGERGDLRYARPRGIRVEIRPVPDGTLEWIRTEQPAPRAAPAPDETKSVRLLGRSRSATLHFHDGRGWHDRWPIDSTGAPRLPRAVRIEVVDTAGNPAAVEAWIAQGTRIEPASQRP